MDYRSAYSHNFSSKVFHIPEIFKYLPLFSNIAYCFFVLGFYEFLIIIDYSNYFSLIGHIVYIKSWLFLSLFSRSSFTVSQVFVLVIFFTTKQTNKNTSFQNWFAIIQHSKARFKNSKKP